MTTQSVTPRIILGSSLEASIHCRDLVGKVTLAVTSPPYHNAISYESHAENPEANYRPRQGIDYANMYLPFIGSAWEETWRMLRPGGYLAVNVGSVLENGFHYPLPHDVISQLTNSSVQWEFIRSIIWFKVTAGVKRAGSVIQHKLPGYWYPNIMTEHIIIVRKPGPMLPLNKNVPHEWWEHVWDLAPVPPRTIEHPAPYPEDLPHRLIKMLTQPFDWVMDPFNGAGATTKASFDLGRNSLGFDIEQKYVELATKRLYEKSAVRTSQLKVEPIPANKFTPGKMKGITRHGAGQNTRTRK